MTTEQAKPTWIRLTESDRQRVERLARKEDRSIAGMLARLVRERLDQIDAASSDHPRAA
jgi:hypothetical protein